MTDLERLDAENRRLKDELAAAKECLRMTAAEAEQRLMAENADLRQKLADARLERLGRAAYEEFADSDNWDAMSAMARDRWGRIAAAVLREDSAASAAWAAIPEGWLEAASAGNRGAALAAAADLCERASQKATTEQAPTAIVIRPGGADKGGRFDLFDDPRAAEAFYRSRRAEGWEPQAWQVGEWTWHHASPEQPSDGSER